MSAIRFSHVSKAYADGKWAVNNLDLEINDGEFMVLVGPSGCGKSTALRMIAGLEDITSGTLSIGGVVANDLSPRRRNVAMIFQSYALYPHLSVAENLGFGLKVRGEPRASAARRVAEAAAMLELRDLLDRRPGQLSGGQRQRVAMGRALVRHPAAFLMDEPLSNLDARLRGQMRVEIARLQRAAGVTTVYVTHDQVEAMTMGDRIAVLRGGVLQQLGLPRDLYDRPANLFVASFLGAPPLNLLRGVPRSNGEGIDLELPGGRLSLPDGSIPAHAGLLAFLDREIVVGVRPEIAALTDDDEGVLKGRVVFQEDLGASLLTTIALTSESADGLPIAWVEDLGEADIPSVSPRLRINSQGGRRHPPDTPVRIRLDLERLLFFDSATRLAID